MNPTNTAAARLGSVRVNAYGCLLKVNTHHIQSASDDEVDFKDSGFHQDSALQQVRTRYTNRGTLGSSVLTTLIPNRGPCLHISIVIREAASPPLSTPNPTPWRVSALILMKPDSLMLAYGVNLVSQVHLARHILLMFPIQRARAHCTSV